MDIESPLASKQIRKVIREEISAASNSALILSGSKPYMNTPEAAKYTGYSTQYLEGARHRGDGPPYIQVVRRVKYTPTDLDEWMLKHRIDPG
ncbi:MAG: helix-turn-helix domain-containing protein, partial [Deltaproteobacteria bacterium]|nr:helix-turn-helix domain-containing protein [Deltaproteobacteria bacterium]